MILSKKFFTKMSLSKTPEKGPEMKERDTRKKNECKLIERCVKMN